MNPITKTDDIREILIKNFKTQNSVDECRTEMFLPLTKIRIDSKYYKDMLKNRGKRVVAKTRHLEYELHNKVLGQIHRDILDIILSSCKIDKNGNYVSTVSLYEIAQKLGIKKDNRTIRGFIEDIDNARIKIKIKKDNNINPEEIKMGFIKHYAYSEKHRKYKFYLDELYLFYFHKVRVGIDYRKKLQDILKIDNGYVKAVVRYLMSEKYNHRDIFFILEMLGLKITKDVKTKVKKAFLKYKDYLKEHFNITYDPLTCIPHYVRDGNAVKYPLYSKKDKDEAYKEKVKTLNIIKKESNRREEEEKRKKEENTTK